MVIDFDGIEVQMPSIETKERSVFIKSENGKYVVVTKGDYEKLLKASTKKTAIKVEKEIKNAVEESTDEE